MVKVLVGLMEIKEMSIPSSLATTCDTYKVTGKILIVVLKYDWEVVNYFSVDPLATLDSAVGNTNGPIVAINCNQDVVTI